MTMLLGNSFLDCLLAQYGGKLQHLPNLTSCSLQEDLDSLFSAFKREGLGIVPLLIGYYLEKYFILLYSCPAVSSGAWESETPSMSKDWWEQRSQCGKNKELTLLWSTRAVTTFVMDSC